MKKILIIIAMLPMFANAQKAWKIAGQVVSFAGAGFLQQKNDIATKTFYRIKQTHPNVSQQWADPKVSWRNKYKDGVEANGAAFPLSTSLLVFATDDYHLTQFVTGVAMAGGVCFSLSLYEKPNWKQIILTAAVSYVSYRAGGAVADLVYPK